jgi:hypothetical protein
MVWLDVIAGTYIVAIDSILFILFGIGRHSIDAEASALITFASRLS